jgi:hypothetical protein
MMLVAARYGRQGLGRTLMEHLLRAAGPGVTVTLFATDMGRPLYEKLGFRVVRGNVSFAGRFRPDDSKKRGERGAAAGLPGGIRLATEADLPPVLALDRTAFGADRSRIITRLPAFADHIVVLEAGQPAGGSANHASPDLAGGHDGPGRGIAGYAAAWRNGPASTVIGPLVAPDGEAARRLIAELAAHTGTPVRLDLDPDRPELPGWAEAHGLDPVGRTVVMARGDNPLRGTPGHLFTPISVALA